MKNLSKLLTWPIAAVLIAGGVCFTLIAIYAEGETRDALFGANGLVMSIVMALIRMSSADSGPPSLPPPAALLVLAFACSTLPACGASDAMRAAYAEEVARCGQKGGARGRGGGRDWGRGRCVVASDVHGLMVVVKGQVQGGVKLMFGQMRCLHVNV